jgi:alkylation response protein AidB-like acyl-CoA dehydrogenase
MTFELSEEHLMIRQAARDFAQNELLPGVIERDEHQKFPAEQIKKLGDTEVAVWMLFLMYWLWKKFLKLMHQYL